MLAGRDKQVQCFLFYLDGIPAFFQAEFACLLLAWGGAGTHGEDAAIHAHVADLHFVRDAAEGDGETARHPAF